MTLDHPLLLAVLPVLAVVVVALERGVPGSASRRWTRAGVRLLVLALLLVALAGPQREGWHDLERRLVVVRDLATRLPPSAAAEREALGRQALARAEAAGVQISSLAFTTRCAPAGGLPPRSAQSVAAVGLAGARLAFREDETGGVFLLSDGRGDLNGLAAAARALRSDGFAVTAAAVPAQAPEAVAPARVIALKAPAQVRGPFVVRAAVEAPDARPLEVVLLVDGEEHERTRVEARPDAEVSFEELLLYPGLHEIAVALRSGGGSSAYEDMARTLVEVGAPPRVVALLGDAAGSPFRKALTAQGQHVAAVEPDALPAFVADARRVPDLALADATALAALSPEIAGVLVERVRSGLGLLVEAGGSREAWEALAQSPLAAVLPLVPLPEPEPPPVPPAPAPEEAPEPPIEPPEPEQGPGLKAERRPEEALPITLLIVVDRSPSMEGAKLAMAIEGARRAALALSAWDRVGVITFAHESTLDVAPRSARAAGSLPLWLSTVEAGGRGTNIFGALQHAARVLAAEKSPILHLILLTDGRQYPDGPIFGPVVKPMRRRGITITAVGIGRGARLDQLRDIVQWAAGGMVIPVADASQIPTVLTRDTQGVAERRSEDAQRLARLRDPEAQPKPPTPDDPEPAAPPRPREPEEPPEPREPTASPEANGSAERLPLRRVRAHEATLGLADDSLPDVGLPRRSEPAYGAAVLLEREDGRPVLAAGRAGLGRVLVWTLPPRDVGSLAWPALGQMVGQAARAAMAPRGAFAFLPTPRVLQGPNGALLHVDWPRGETHGKVRVRWSAPDGSKELGIFTPDDSADGHPLPAAPVGSLCRLDLQLEGGPTLVPLSYLVRRPPSEPPRAGDRQALSAALGAPLTPLEAFVDSLPRARRPAPEPLWPLFLWSAILLLVLDVWLHRRRGTA